MKILVVDDSPDMCNLMSLLFEREGHEVFPAPEGSAALELVEELGLPDMIFLDYRMEGMDGPAFLKNLEARYPDPELLEKMPIVLMAGLENEEAKSLRVTRILRKPVDLSILINVVQHIKAGKH